MPTCSMQSDKNEKCKIEIWILSMVIEYQESTKIQYEESIKELFVIKMTTDQPLGFMLKILPIRGDKVNHKC